MDEISKSFSIYFFNTSMSDDEPFKIFSVKRRGVLLVKPSDVSACYSEKCDLLNLLPMINKNFHNFYKSSGRYASLSSGLT